MSSSLADLKRPRKWAQMRGGGVYGVSANEYSCAHGAQINVGDLTPYLIYITYPGQDAGSPWWGHWRRYWLCCSRWTGRMWEPGLSSRAWKQTVRNVAFYPVLWTRCISFHLVAAPTLIKKENKFSSYRTKSRRERLQSHIWLTASSYITKYLRISSYIRKPFLIYDFATAPIWISLYLRKIFFSFVSVNGSGSDQQILEHGNPSRRFKLDFVLSKCKLFSFAFERPESVHWLNADAQQCLFFNNMQPSYAERMVRKRLSDPSPPPPHPLPTWTMNTVSTGKEYVHCVCQALTVITGRGHWSAF